MTETGHAACVSVAMQARLCSSTSASTWLSEGVISSPGMPREKSICGLFFNKPWPTLGMLPLHKQELGFGQMFLT